MSIFFDEKYCFVCFWYYSLEKELTLQFVQMIYFSSPVLTMFVNVKVYYFYVYNIFVHVKICWNWWKLTFQLAHQSAHWLSHWVEESLHRSEPCDRSLDCLETIGQLGSQLLAHYIPCICGSWHIYKLPSSFLKVGYVTVY